MNTLARIALLPIAVVAVTFALFWWAAAAYPMPEDWWED